MSIFIARVESVTDMDDGGRIKARITNVDNAINDAGLPFAFPLLPKVLNVKPKIGESVLIFTNDEGGKKQRYYIGPIISQPQRFYKDNHHITSSSMLEGGMGAKTASISNYPDAIGCLPEDDEIAVIGRKNSDIILSDNDIRIRCGVKVISPNSIKDWEVVKFNHANPSYIKLNFFETPLSGKTGEINSSINIVSDYINILSTNGDPYFDGITDRNEKLISDETLKKIIETAHPLPYGDLLVNFLRQFVTTFNTHRHNYTNLPPVQDLSYNQLQEETNKLEDILSKHIRIN